MGGWGFAKNEDADRPSGAPGAAAGKSGGGTVVDGPSEDLDRLVEVYGAAILSAREEIRVMTPYFLPPRELIAAFHLAVKRGVKIAIILPATNDQAVVHWAAQHMLPEILELGVRVYFQPPPFAHTKHFMVDRSYAILGSANLDPRSLRLNFELGLEVFDPDLTKILIAHFEKIRQVSRELTLEEIRERPLPVRLRDAVCWLFSPYL